MVTKVITLIVMIVLILSFSVYIAMLENMDKIINTKVIIEEDKTNAIFILMFLIIFNILNLIGG